MVGFGLDLDRTLAERFGATDDLQDLGRDRVLTGPVHHAGQAHDQVVGVVGRGFHGPLPGGLFRRRGVQQRGVDASFDVAGQQPFENGVG